MKQYIGKLADSIITLFSVLVFLLAAIVIVSVMQTPRGEVPMLFGRTMFQVISPSMEPTLRLGTVVMVKEVQPREIKEGDIISFYSRDAEIYDSIVTHRVTEVRYKNGAISFRTKGDANPSEDKLSVRETQFIGKVVGVSNAIGSFVMLLSYRWIFAMLIVVPLGYIVVSNGYKVIMSIKRKNNKK